MARAGCSIYLGRGTSEKLVFEFTTLRSTTRVMLICSRKVERPYPTQSFTAESPPAAVEGTRDTPVDPSERRQAVDYLAPSSSGRPLGLKAPVVPSSSPRCEETRVDEEELVSAIQDVKDFIDNMRQSLSEDGGMSFANRAMLALIDDQIGVLDEVCDFYFSHSDYAQIQSMHKIHVE